MRKSRFIVAIVLAGMIGLTGCLEETSVSSTGSTAGPKQGAGADGAPAAGTPEGSKQAQYGEVLQVNKGGKVAATLSVAAPQAVPSFFGGFTKPTSGPAFATFVVSFTAEQPGFAVNAFDFFVRTPEGARVQPTIGCEPAFSAATLGQGEKYQGCLTVDVAHGSLVYTSGLFDSSSLVEWPAF